MSKPYQSFEARAFHPDHGTEIMEGTLSFSNVALRFQGHELVLEIPLHRLEAEIEAGEGGRIFFGDAEQPGLRISSSDTEVLEVRSVPRLAALSEEWNALQTRRELVRRIKLVVGFFAVCGVVLWFGMWATGMMVRSIVGKVPPEFERQYGDSLLNELKSQIPFVEDTNRATALAAMAEPLLRVPPGGRPQWQFHVVENEVPNACALPGGHIIVFSELLKLAERPEEVIGVLAHEIAHVTRKHGFRREISSAGPLLVFQVFLNGRGGALEVLAGGSALLVNQSFSQEYETEADDAGWEYLVKANIDPRGMIEMFRKLKAQEEKEKGLLWLPQAFRSHPGLVKRIARLEAKWKKLPRKSGFMELKPGEEGVSK